MKTMPGKTAIRICLALYLLFIVVGLTQFFYIPYISEYFQPVFVHREYTFIDEKKQIIQEGRTYRRDGAEFIYLTIFVLLPLFYLIKRWSKLSKMYQAITVSWGLGVLCIIFVYFWPATDRYTSQCYRPDKYQKWCHINADFSDQPIPKFP